MRNVARHRVRVGLAGSMMLLIPIVYPACVPAQTERRNASPGDGPAVPDAPAAASTPPSNRGGAPVVRIPRTGKIVLFGGMNPITGDTFEFDSASDSWRELMPELAGATPPRRCHHTFVSVPGGTGGILFGGFSFAGRFNDTWDFDGEANVWTERTTTGDLPQKRCLHDAVVLPDQNEMLMYGGIHGAGVSASDFFDDTHVLDLATSQWTRLAASGPGKLSGMILMYSSSEKAALMWGGKQVDTYPTTLWRFDPEARTWSAVPTTGDIPIGREDPTWFWDDDRSVLTIFSGRNDSDEGVLLDDGYELDVPRRRWRRIATISSPAPRWRASSVFEPASQRGWMFGGWRDFGGRNAFNDTWWYDPVTQSWARATPDAP